ncbi:hypothetical protein [Methylovirgula sp. 4M-Z18]|uniref:hypothetical protein n=1 Tax=Methylovirgula sp. 4M-Z18 TaxID=2293567 RepID=UPI000E2F1633|nr:hypothetical protein [Methylovirgula sp. 4M-Z18]RFB80016.1 hypothetical protein DYH55_00235 [Methylovirgula sp. 4M-Z18]
MTDFAPDMRLGDAIETPTQAIVADAFAPVSVTDESGRKIEAVRLKPSERFGIKRMMGEEASNSSLYDEIFLITHCRAIDGERIARPASMLQAMALMDRLGDAGIRALGGAAATIYGFNKQSAEQTAKN